jgi:hypothetical protein
MDYRGLDNPIFPMILGVYITRVVRPFATTSFNGFSSLFSLLPWEAIVRIRAEIVRRQSS